MNLKTQTSVVLVIGVNGVGKTTTIGKLAGKMRGQGKKVVLAAADTFRAAAGDQLKEWAHRSDADLIGGQEGADPAAIVYDAVAAAKARKADILLVDTAGRLHNQKEPDGGTEEELTVCWKENIRKHTGKLWSFWMQRPDRMHFHRQRNSVMLRILQELS